MSGTRGIFRAGLDRATRRRALMLSAATAASAVFALIDYDPLKLVPVTPVQAVALLVLALVTLAGTILGSRPILLGVGAVMIVLGLIRLVTYGQAFGLLAGSAGTAALLTGLGTALIGVTFVSDQTAPQRRATPGRRE